MNSRMAAPGVPREAEAFDAVATLRELRRMTMLVQPGKPVVCSAHRDAPRVLIST